MKRILGLIMMCMLLAIMPAGCSAPKGDAGTDTGEVGSKQSSVSEETAAQEEAHTSEIEDNKEIIEMKMTINDTPVKVSWENNESVSALAEMTENGPVTIGMEPYGGFEQVGSIGATLPSNDTNIKTKAGDIMLYTGSQMVIFYGSNSWAYTRLGKITDKSDAELGKLLGGNGVTVTIAAE